MSDQRERVHGTPLDTDVIINSVDDSIPPIIVDDQGPIRYDWPNLKLLYVGGAGVADIARALTVEFPDHFERVQNTINRRSAREEWPKVREDSANLIRMRPESSKNNVSLLERPMSQNVLTTAANTRSVRKERYLNSTSAFIDKAAQQLDNHPISSLADAALAAKLMEPVHAIAKDVHGLNAKDGSNAVQVNILSEWAGSGPPEVSVETRETTDESGANSS